MDVSAVGISRTQRCEPEENTYEPNSEVYAGNHQWQTRIGWLVAYGIITYAEASSRLGILCDGFNPKSSSYCLCSSYHSRRQNCKLKADPARGFVQRDASGRMAIDRIHERLYPSAGMREQTRIVYSV